MTESVDQMSFPIKTVVIEKPRKKSGELTITRRLVRQSPAGIQNTTPTDQAEPVNQTEDTNPTQAKIYRFGEGKPDEMGRKNTDQNYGIPPELSTEKELQKFQKKKEAERRFSDDDIPF